MEQTEASAEQTFQERIAQLDDCIKRTEQVANKKAKSIPVIVLAGLATPVLIGLVLYIVQPRFVQTEEDDEFKRDTRKVVKYTAFITLAMWAAMYGFTYTEMYKTRVAGVAV